MDGSHAARIPPASSAARSSPHVHLTSSSSTHRGVGTPPPRPRLFARTGVDRKSPPPPARLAPITPTATPVLSPDASTQLLSADGQRPLFATRDEEAAHRPLTAEGASQPPQHQRRQDLNEEEGEGTPNNADAWWTPSSSAFATPVSHSSTVTGSGRPSQHLTALPTRAVLTPPRCGSGASGNADWSAHGPIEAMLAAKRERLISSADTQHSMASSSTPPPRCKRAVSDHASTAAVADSGAASRVTALQPQSRKHQQQQQPEERQRLSGSTSRSSSSRGATSDGSSSDLVAAAAAAAAVASSAPAGAAAQCLVLDDSVDATAVVTAAQLQQMVAQTAHAGEAAATPYETRLITAEVLRDWTGWEDLELVLATQLRVDAEAMLGVDQMAAKLPRLASLKLNGSRVPRLRQLGTGFHALKYLWLNSCHLTDLRGLAVCCPALVELYVSFNFITDLSPALELSATLEVLDVEGNLLEDAASLAFVLSSLHRVTTLSVQGNPLTCEHQQRVRDDYAALCESDPDGQSDAAALPPAHGKFGHVLRAWVRALMPQLHTLNDEPLTAPAAPHSAPSPHAVHVDPLDDRLALELRLVEACVRDTDPFDPLLEAVEEANRQVYSRPSTSCSGARPRLAPTTAMGAARPSTSARAGAATSRRLGESTAATSASELTTGAVLAGNATASLRRRLATPTPSPDSANREREGSDGDVSYGSAEHLARGVAGARLGGPASRPESAAEAEEARVAALLADDSEEDEWELYKAALLMPGRASSTAVTAAATVAAADGARGAAEPAMAAEEDGFDKDLKAEWNRLRLRMAKAARA